MHFTIKYPLAILLSAAVIGAGRLSAQDVDHAFLYGGIVVWILAGIFKIAQVTALVGAVYMTCSLVLRIWLRHMIRQMTSEGATLFVPQKFHRKSVLFAREGSIFAARVHHGKTEGHIWYSVSRGLDVTGVFGSSMMGWEIALLMVSIQKIVLVNGAVISDTPLLSRELQELKALVNA